MTLELRSVLVWLGAFLALELTPIFWPGCPWTTFTGTVRGGISWWHALAIYVVVFLIVLGGHFDYGWRARYLILLAVIGAVLIGTRAIEKAL